MRKPIQMQRLVWIKVNGAIPVDCVIHHKDFDRTNNTLENLELMTKKVHDKLHLNVRMGLNK